jgi:fermentation-respiration switch protein FrsA (DUF1100 family)
VAGWYSLLERHFIYFPRREVVLTPRDVGLPFEDVRFEASDGVSLHGWFVPARDGAPTDNHLVWLWMHGNAGNIGDRVQSLRALSDELGVAVFLPSYRGYGRSGGTPSEQATYRDAEVALMVLSERYGVAADRVALFGQSLGSAVAVDLATRHRPAGLVLESGFTSIADMGRRRFPALPVRALLQNRYDSVAKIGRVDAPVLIIHGDQDDIVPVEMATRLFEAASEPKRLLVMSGAGHNDVDLVGGSRYFAALRTFIQSLEDASLD